MLNQQKRISSISHHNLQLAKHYESTPLEFTIKFRLGRKLLVRTDALALITDRNVATEEDMSEYVDIFCTWKSTFESTQDDGDAYQLVDAESTSLKRRLD